MRKFEFVSNEEAIKSNDGLEFAFYLPERSTKHSAGYDFRSPMDTIIPKHGNVKIPTGIKVQMNDDDVLLILPRSGMGFKYGVHLMNTVGVIDADYYGNPDNEGHIFIKLANPSDEDIIIKQGDKFAQGIFFKYLTTEDEEEVTNERVSGIGSTGV